MITTGAMPDIEQDLAEIVPFWGNLDLSQRAFLAQRSRRMKFDAGSHVQGAGAGCAGVVFVRSGRLRAFMLSDQGRRSRSSTCSPASAAYSRPRASYP